jgi:hypothetical protein
LLAAAVVTIGPGVRYGGMTRRASPRVIRAMLVAGLLSAGAVLGGVFVPCQAIAGRPDESSRRAVSGQIGHGSLTRVAALTPGVVGSPVASVSVSGRVAIAGNAGGIYVYQEPDQGWADAGPSATLSDPGGGVIAGNVVVVNPGHGATTPGFLHVFVEPAAGWAGTVGPAATLTASDGASLGRAAISGDTIAAVGSGSAVGSGAVYVFTRPVGGWVGSLNEVAKVTDSQHAGFGSVAFSGRSIVAGSRGIEGDRTDVFSEPSGGWPGTEQQSATLFNPGFSVGLDAAAAHTVLASDELFTEPRHGWSGSVARSATLLPEGFGDYTDGSGALSSSIAAVTGSREGDEHSCPCPVALWLFSKPAGGWHSAMTATPVITTINTLADIPVSLQGPYVFTAGGATVSVYRQAGRFGTPVAPPQLTSAALTGLAAGHPTVRFRLHARDTAPRIDSVAITLPPGLQFSTSHRRLAAGVSVGRNTNYTLKRHGRELVASLGSPPPQTVAVNVHPPALTETKPLLSSIRQHPGTPPRVPIRIRVVDRVGDVFGLTLSAKSS